MGLVAPLPAQPPQVARSAPGLRVLSLNLGRCERLRIGERSVLSGIGKRPVDGPVAVARLGLEGDEQADLSVHGGLETLPPGFMGENLTVEGLLEHDVYVGDRLHFPDCVLRVTAPREPCYKFNAVMGFVQAGRTMALAGNCGYYLAVDQPGTIAAGQEAWLQAGQRGLSIARAIAGKWAKHAR